MSESFQVKTVIDQLLADEYERPTQQRDGCVSGG